ncbi:uncharacterized protein LOC114533632 [Dendronephthya gigantea]|uniref:uncharacterized protein LOC114533632 n=1 Tax=Dendronephthya gigantea TaxID=151771 RepID=UPI0010695AE4|nr:uncharacterized protein LOC114533632 [Dendronephthya gigantea]
MDGRLDKILKRFWEWRLDEAPEFGTMVGDHKRDGELDDLSLAAYAKRLQGAKNFIAELEKLDVEKLSKDNKLNYELLHLELTTYIDGMKFKCYLFPISGLEGPQVDFRKTVSWMKNETDDDCEKILHRYHKFSKQAEQIIELLKKGAETGYVNAKISMEKVPDQFKTIIETPAKQSAFYEPFKDISDCITEKKRNSLQERALAAINEELYPAYTKIKEHLEKEYIPACRDDIACISLPSGIPFYEAALKFHLSTDMSADDVHQTGLDEVERIKGRMHVVMEQVGFEGTLEEFLEHLKNDSQFYMDNKDEFMALYNNTCAEIDKLMPTYFKTLPKMKYEIKEMPPEVAITAPGAFYNAGSLEGRPGIFYINTYQFEKKPTYNCPSLCLHEAVPGHHHQGSLGIEQTDLPAFRRYVEDRHYYEVPSRFALYGAYMEGWGLYSEYLGEEMKVYKTPYDLFGRLSAEMFRACRCVVDTGMHMKGWTRQEAVDYMAKNAGLPDHEIQAEIDRYITWPGQACSYKIGEMKIVKLRENAESKLGDKFDLREFHDAVLLESAIPMSILEELIEEYINSHK